MDEKLQLLRLHLKPLLRLNLKPLPPPSPKERGPELNLQQLTKQMKLIRTLLSWISQQRMAASQSQSPLYKLIDQPSNSLNFQQMELLNQLQKKKLFQLKKRQLKKYL
jgi:hypothetical protein